MVSTRPLIDDLSRQIRQLEHSRAAHAQPWAVDSHGVEQGIVSSGVAELDALLPRGGFKSGTITEWLSPHRGCGASTQTLCLAAQSVRAGQVLAIVDFAGDFYPPSAAALGVDLRKTVVIRPSSKTDGFWALEQLLRSPTIGAVWSNLDRIGNRHSKSSSGQSPSRAAMSSNNATTDNQLFRRLQLAAESGECVSFLMRPMSARHEPSWADLRLSVEPPGTRTSRTSSVNVILLRSRESFAAGQVHLHLPHISGLSEVDRVLQPIQAIESERLNKGTNQRAG
jgi:protein ImuA